ncbi:MAG: hypothetical protein RI935_262 [Candidatus Parcubacteria bacterium]|jgi:hypothetical protein
MDTIRFSIDVEAGGDNPHDRALLEIGISVVGDESQAFEIMFKPDPLPFDRHALGAIRRPIKEFIEKGVDLVIGINQMLDWIDQTSVGRKIEFVGLNMPYDWMFFKVCVAKVRAVNTLPHKAYDIPSYGAGVFGVPLSEVGDKRLIKEMMVRRPELVSKYSLYKYDSRCHTGLDDAKYQGRLLLALEEYASVWSKL